MDIPVQIPNGTHQVIIQLPNITNQVNVPPSDVTASLYVPIALVLATFALVGVTWYYNWRTHEDTQKSNKITNDSNEQLKISNDIFIQELESKFRPVISRHVHDKRKYHRQQINDEACSIIPEKIMFHIINTGTLPAIKVSYKHYVERRESPSNVVKLSPTGSIVSDPISSLAPNEYYSIDLPLENREMFNTIKNDNKCYFGFIIWYSDENEKRYYYHTEGYFKKSALMLYHVDMKRL